MVLAIKSRDQTKGGKQRKSIQTKGLTAGSLIFGKKLFEFKPNIILFLIKRGFDKQKKKKSFHSIHAMHYKYSRGGGCADDAQKIKSAKSCTYRWRNDMI